MQYGYFDWITTSSRMEFIRLIIAQILAAGANLKMECAAIQKFYNYIQYDVNCFSTFSTDKFFEKYAEQLVN